MTKTLNTIQNRGVFCMLWARYAWGDKRVTKERPRARGTWGRQAEAARDLGSGLVAPKSQFIRYEATVLPTGLSGWSQLLTFICSTPKKASCTIPFDILEVPRVRSVKMMGTSVMRKPSW